MGRAFQGMAFELDEMVGMRWEGLVGQLRSVDVR